MKKNNARILEFVLIIIIIFLGLLLIFYGITYPKAPKEKQYTYKFDVLSPNVTVKSMKVPAVDKQGNGVITTIVVEVMPGVGRTLVDINNLLFWADTQESIRKAKEVAENYTGINLSNYDLIYHIYTNASIVGGPSAGAPITILTIAALLNKEIRPDVTITGSINYDGSIGPVGDIMAKAKIAKENGASLLLVPLTQSKEEIIEEKEVCKKIGEIEYCTKEQKVKIVNIAEKVGIEVKEVANIEEALSYILI
ncbi:MAG: S16 family serine protease [Candidatus Pacearchaeota archaeon]